MLLTREQLVGKHFLPYEEVDVPALKGKVGVQGMTAMDALGYYKLIEKRKGNGTGSGGGDLDMEALAKLLVRCVVDQKRERVYTDEEWPEVMRWPNVAVQAVARVAMRLNNGSAEGN